MGILEGSGVFDGLQAVRAQYAAMERCEFKPVARGSQILAGQHGIFITIKGPCGDGHTMNYAEARNLRDWLIANVPEKKGAVSMGEETTGQYLFDKDAMKRELKEFHHGFKGISSEVSRMRLIQGSMDIIHRHTMGLNVPEKPNVCFWLGEPT